MTPTNCKLCSALIPSALIPSALIPSALIPSALATADWLRQQPDALRKMSDRRPRGEFLDSWMRAGLERAIRFACAEIAGVCKACSQRAEWEAAEEAEVKRRQAAIRELSAAVRR